MSRCSVVYRSVGSNGGGWGDSIGKLAKGFPMMLRTILNLSGKSASSGCILRATSLYFFFAVNVDTCSKPSKGFWQSSDMFVVGCCY
jgi:hypothetical protein